MKSNFHSFPISSDFDDLDTKIKDAPIYTRIIVFVRDQYQNRQIIFHMSALCEFCPRFNGVFFHRPTSRYCEWFVHTTVILKLKASGIQ